MTADMATAATPLATLDIHLRTEIAYSYEIPAKATCAVDSPLPSSGGLKQRRPCADTHHDPPSQRGTCGDPSMSYNHISPELALIDPRLATQPRKVDPMIAPFDSEDGTPPGPNGSPPRPDTQDPPSIEGLLFAAGAISADQLGEVVRDAVLNQRPVSAVALERGFVTKEVLDEVIAASGANASLGEALGERDPEASRTVVSVVQPVGAPVAPQTLILPPPEVPAPVTAAAVQQAVAAAAPRPVAHQTLILPPPEPPAPVTAAAVQQSVAAAAPPPSADAPAIVVLPPQAPLPRIVTASADHDAPVAAAGHASDAPASFAVSIRLDSGERVTVSSADGFDRATELARGIVETLSVSDGWPFASGRFIRPGAIVSVDIERALGD